MTTPNIEELIARIGSPHWSDRGDSLLKEAADALQSQAERINELEAELSRTDVLLEECKMDWSGDVTQIKAEHKREVDTLRAQLAALQVDDELPEPVAHQFYGSDFQWLSFSNERHYQNTLADGGWEIRGLYTADQLRQAQAMVLAKMVPLEKDADMFWNHDDAERNYNSIDEFLNEEICSGMGVEVGGEFTMRRAISLPNIKIRVTSIDEEACEAEYEIITSGITGEPK